MQILWHFDLVSPFAWLALPAVERIARQHAVEPRPVVLGAILKHWGQLGPAEIAPKRLATYRLVRFQAERAGATLRFPPAHPFRSLDALRLLAAREAPSLAQARAALAFVWQEGRDAVAELGALRERLGGAPQDGATRDGATQDGATRDGAPQDGAGPGGAGPGGAGSDEAAKARLRRWTEEAVAAGVFGVPTLQAGAELFWGADAMPMAEAFLADPALFDAPEMRRLAALPDGASRRRSAGSP